MMTVFLDKPHKCQNEEGETRPCTDFTRTTLKRRVLKVPTSLRYTSNSKMGIALPTWKTTIERLWSHSPSLTFWIQIQVPLVKPM